MSLSERIKQARIKERMTQKEVAKKAGVSRVAIGNYERGNRIPPADVAAEIAKALNADVNYLLNGKTLEERDGEYTDKLKSKAAQADAMKVYLEGLSPDEIKAIDTIVHGLRNNKED